MDRKENVYMLYPFKFTSIYKEKLWGGRNLEKVLQKELPDSILVGESWELCGNKEETSIVCNGSFKGKSILELLNEYPSEILGTKNVNYSKSFPLLIKFIDANDKLSVQVHPDDEYAKKNNEEFGKTEMWYIVDAKPGAKLVFGLKDEVDQNTFKEAIVDKKIEETLKEIEVCPGDVVYIPAGIVHAIGEGIVLAEIQQNSNTTYRVYDWGRVGLDGKPRQLHIHQALETVDFINKDVAKKIEGLRIEEVGYETTIYVCCPYFTMEMIEIQSGYKGLLNGERFEIFIAIEGDFGISFNQSKKENIKKGQTVLLPASLGQYMIEGKGKIIKTYIKDVEELKTELLNKGYKENDIKNIAGISSNL